MLIFRNAHVQKEGKKLGTYYVKVVLWLFEKVGTKMKTSLELLRQTRVMMTNVADESKGLAKGLDTRGTGLTLDCLDKIGEQNKYGR